MSPIILSPTSQLEFNNRVWEVVRRIPYGRVTTYGHIASVLSAPNGIDSVSYKAFGPRWVGSALASCPSGIPWHRVINAQGKISLASENFALQQRQLLISEGIIFDHRDRVDLKSFGWFDS